MSTNFYLEVPTCVCCGRPKERLHIGKRFGTGNGETSFLFHTVPENAPEHKKEDFFEFDVNCVYKYWRKMVLLGKNTVVDGAGYQIDSVPFLNEVLGKIDWDLAEVVPGEFS